MEEMRLEEQRQKARQMELVRKEMIKLKNKSKNINMQRAMRKREYEEEQMREKLEENEQRQIAVDEEKVTLKNMRMDALFNMQK